MEGAVVVTTQDQKQRYIDDQTQHCQNEHHCTARNKDCEPEAGMLNSNLYEKTMNAKLQLQSLILISGTSLQETHACHLWVWG